MAIKHTPLNSNLPAFRKLAGISLLGLASVASHGQLLYQEGFNTDGEAASPQRYTTVGRDVYEPARIEAELGRTDQAGPIYWAHNFEVSYAGVPAPTSGRRIAMAWDSTIANASSEVQALFISTVKWLLNNKADATIIIGPGSAALGPSLTEALTNAGYNVIDDDGVTPSASLGTLGDLYIHGVGLADPSRGATASIPVINISALDNDDLLLTSIGSTVAFQAGQATITAPGHPAVGGLTGSFDIAEGIYTWNLLGDTIPGNATVLASFKQQIIPTIASLADVDAMIAGTRASAKTTAQVAALDFNQGSAGDWTIDDVVPGEPAGVWGIHAKGTLNVTQAGIYRFALGTDDGGRLQIDLNKNGFDAGDTIIEDAGPHGHTVQYANATFPTTGVYNFQVVAFNSGGGGDLEVSVANSEGDGQPTIPELPEAWEVIGSPDAISPVQANSTIEVNAFVPSGDVQEVTVPFMVLLNGPNDNPPGSVFGGGPFTGFEGAGFFGMSGGNKWPYPDGIAYRSLTLPSINVSGKSDLKVTVAVAATFLDFETDDYLEIWARPNGESSEAVRVARFSAPDGSTKYFVDTANPSNRLGLQFKDVTFSLPTGATDLILEFRAATTWWNEIVAFDNVRVSSGSISSPPINVSSIAKEGNNIRLTWTGGTAPFLVQSTTTLGGTWNDLVTTSERTISIPNIGRTHFFRIVDQTTKTVTLFTTLLNGQNERPQPVTTPGSGVALVSVEGLSARYWVSYSNLTQPATMAHIHGPAPATGTAGPFGPLTSAGALGNSGAFIGTQALTQAQADAIATGQAYVNVHSNFAPGGEVRGQLAP